MPGEHQHSSRVSGGLLGVIALALAGSGVGVVSYWAFGNNNAEQAQPAAKPLPGSLADNSVGISDTIGAGDADLEVPAFETVDGPDRVAAETGTITDGGVEKPPAVRPVPLPNPPQPNRRILEEGAFIVRFNKDPDLDRHLKMFRSDKAASRAAFAKWAAQHPELDGLTLERVNYSGEVVLSYRGADDADPVASAKAMQARLNELPFVRYADPDYTAFPGKGE